MSNDPAARVNGNLLKSYVNGTVRLVGRVQNVSSNQVTMEAADGVSIIVQTDTPANYTCSIMEVIGSVNTDLSLKEIMCVPFGDNFDLGLYNQMLEVTNGKHKNSFYV